MDLTFSSINVCLKQFILFKETLSEYFIYINAHLFTFINEFSMNVEFN